MFWIVIRPKIIKFVFFLFISYANENDPLKFKGK
jgi:hypothetical protein